MSSFRVGLRGESESDASSDNDLLLLATSHRISMVYWGNRSLVAVRETVETYRRRMRARLAAGQPLYLEIDPNLGWRLQSSCRHPNWSYTTDSFGNRRSSPNSGTISGAAYQIAIAGNSYVHGDEAADDETWVWILQERLGSDFQVHNLGVTAYSTDQAFLRLQEFAKDNRPDMAVLALTTTDIYRNLNMCRAFIMNDFEVPLFKPRFIMDGNALALRKPPASTLDSLPHLLEDADVLRYLAAHDVFFPTVGRQAAQIVRRFRVPVPDVWEINFEQAVIITARIGHQFVKWCQTRGVVPVLLILPVYWGAFVAGREFELLAREFNGKVWLIDARAVFTPERRQLPRPVLAHRFNHFTRETSAWLAAFIGDHLREAVERIKRS